MKIFISADIEGVAGVVHPQQGQQGNAEYERARRLMTLEVNAAIAGAFEGGASAVLVNDSHADMRNLLPDELDPRAELILGKPKPFSMATGLDGSFGGVFLTGHHARARAAGVLAHTVNGFAFGRIKVRGIEMGEPALYGAYAGELGVPVLLLTGEDTVESENRGFFPEAQFAVVKHAVANRAARSLSPERARELIQRLARQAVSGKGAQAWRIDNPEILEIEMNTPTLCDLALTIPVARRVDAVSLRIPVATMAEAIGWINTISAMSAMLR